LYYWMVVGRSNRGSCTVAELQAIRGALSSAGICVACKAPASCTRWNTVALCPGAWRVCRGSNGSARRACSIANTGSRGRAGSTSSTSSTGSTGSVEKTGNQSTHLEVDRLEGQVLQQEHAEARLHQRLHPHRVRGASHLGAPPGQPLQLLEGPLQLPLQHAAVQQQHAVVQQLLGSCLQLQVHALEARAAHALRLRGGGGGGIGVVRGRRWMHMAAWLG
jgi:hypothetical protein